MRVLTFTKSGNFYLEGCWFVEKDLNRLIWVAFWFPIEFFRIYPCCLDAHPISLAKKSIEHKKHGQIPKKPIKTTVPVNFHNRFIHFVCTWCCVLSCLQKGHTKWHRGPSCFFVFDYDDTDRNKNRGKKGYSINILFDTQKKSFKQT